MVAIRAADLRPAAGPRLGKDGRTALTVARPGRIATGDLVVFLKPVAVAPAVVRRAALANSPAPVVQDRLPPDQAFFFSARDVTPRLPRRGAGAGEVEPGP
jgi:hypothetical protein